VQDIVECNTRALALEKLAAEAEALRVVAEAEVEERASGGSVSPKPAPVSPINAAEGSEVDDIIAARSKGGASSTTATAILKSLKTSTLGRFLSSKPKPKPKVRGPLPPPPPGAQDSSNMPSIDALELKDQPSLSRGMATPLFGGGSGGENSCDESSSRAATEGTTLSAALGESALDHMAQRAEAIRGSGAESALAGGDVGEGDDLEFAGASLLDEHAMASEALEAPRALVTTANTLVAKRKFSEALTHYYDALEVRIVA
jgi:hypothetical protein